MLGELAVLGETSDDNADVWMVVATDRDNLRAVPFCSCVGRIGWDMGGLCLIKSRKLIQL